MLIESCENYTDEFDECRFIIAGEGKGDLYDNLLSMREKLKLEQYIKFLGYYEDIQNFYCGIDIFVLPSISEGFSIVTIEAMASGLPVIVSSSGGPEEIVINKKNGLVYRTNDVMQLVDAIKVLIKSKNLKDELGREAKNYVAERFSMKAMVEKYQTEYFILIKRYQ